VGTTKCLSSSMQVCHAGGVTIRTNYPIEFKGFKNCGLKLVMVVQICNLNYSGGRDHEDHGSRLALAKSLQDSSRRQTQYKYKEYYEK
jgi:hypothetical protein